MLHLINAGASQQLAFSIDEHDLWIFSADGAFVLPQKVQVTATTLSLTAAAVAALCRCILLRFADVAIYR
jgi:FtsP/CotA-like multicopper oxidase with cupredoxin domain